MNPRPVQKFLPVKRIEKKGNRISFCVYGQKLKYIVGAVHNVILAKQLYPDWICRFYIHRETQLIKILSDLGAEVFVTDKMNLKFGQIHPFTWRFLALEDELIDRVIFRDVDSRIMVREVKAVEEWIKSDKDFHRMKEGPHINDPPILSGMWGAKTGKLNISKLLSSYKKWEDPGQPLPGDFFFLENKVWPLIKDSCLYHGVYEDRYGPATPFPEHGPIEYGFVGARVEDDKWGM